jgi:acyl carrier protein
MNRDEVFAGIRATIADSLALKADEIAIDKRLIDDLGADSLDFIDILFALEKRFGIKVRDGDMDFVSRLDFSSPDVMKHGYLTRATVDRLREWLPALAHVPDPDKVSPRQLFSMITVETLCVLVERKLSRR